MLRLVIDTNLWIRALLGGPVTLPLLGAWKDGRFRALVSDSLLEELDDVRQRPRLRRLIRAREAEQLLEQLRWRGVRVSLTTIPPQCRDLRDHPVLATAIDGKAKAIVSGDADLRADDDLRAAMLEYGVEIWGIERFLQAVSQNPVES
jgi:uncharacterized protein